MNIASTLVRLRAPRGVCCARLGHMQSAIRLWLFALALRPALAQTPPNLSEILKKVSETYKAASQYELVADTTGHESAPGHMLFAFKAPNKYRLEGAMPGMSGNDSAFSEGVIVYDGSAAWFYLPKSNQYGSFPASALTGDDAGDLKDLTPGAMDQFMMSRYRSAADLTDSKFLREEKIEFAGAKVDCYVVSGSKGEVIYTWWVDKKRNRILREDNATSSSVFTTIKLGEPLSDNLFKFEPPPGARRVETQP